MLAYLKTHLEMSGRMNEKENEAANLCKIRTSVLYADSVFGPTCLEIFSKHVRLTSLRISDFPLSLDEFKALVCQSQNCSVSSAQNLSNFDDEPGKRYLKTISQLFSYIKSPYYVLEIQLLRGQQVASKQPPISSQVFPKKAQAGHNLSHIVILFPKDYLWEG